jgi:phosphatidate cytidylyltransferase
VIKDSKHEQAFAPTLLRKATRRPGQIGLGALSRIVNPGFRGGEVTEDQRSCFQSKVKSVMTHNLTQRILTGVPLAVLAVLFLRFTPELPFTVIAVLIAGIGVWEIGQALNHRNVPIQCSVLLLVGLACLLSFWLIWKTRFDLAWGVLMLTGLVVLVASLIKIRRYPLLVFWYLLPVVWIIGPIVMLILLRFEISPQNGSGLILLIIVVAACNDIAAYFGGKRFGRHRLAPSISPQKTIEGSLFGLCGGLVAGLLFRQCFLPEYLSPLQLAPILLILAVAAQAGDLFESKFKRFCRIKDSSALIPGHGGLLDRIDAYLFAIPVFVGISYLFDLHHF